MNKLTTTLSNALLAGVISLLISAWSGVSKAQEIKTASKIGTNSAVVIMYHRFGEKALPTTNIRIDQFEAHMKELTSGKYTILPLSEILSALRQGLPLANHTLAITIDDAFTSVYREAWPRLRKAGLPFTLFVATDAIERGTKSYMSWDQIRELANGGVTIGSQTASHPHMPVLSPARMRSELQKSNARFEKELGARPTLFAYPYGEANQAAMAAAREAGFVASFGQHSGTLHGQANFNYLPRFAMNENYGSLSRFRMAANALSLFATDISPVDPTLGANPPAFGFTAGKQIKDIKRIACYSSRHGKVAPMHLGSGRVEVRFPNAFSPGHGRVNCTLSAPGGRWRWFGHQFFIPKK
ncbi:MAG: polysaccharide deacetylase family protein [Rhodospirillales bacterium]|jgi:peptidoglycan/xylan/chitin deacetylase (PgdA/CDA1 family)|nr:polysaccharide deacetylase family protein [Rhodospirillales bacterium]MBT4005562.1 polysaccharide deacetylase family protein [Rhodospirillales bacterium]MBT5076310.1 polysaccharide deacetylase family protein [Rhodospirillales bacterium]MBT5112281.1 polysaccharide deacetylase family protein [Rhodospirillales bacterium]MBT5671982.1 polysaccharide deacetylase family protein [Rhodospirillales bacterium]